jgi:hypothetical protein
MIDEPTLEERLRRTFDAVTTRALDDVAPAPVHFVETQTPKRPSRRGVLVPSGALIVVLVTGGVVWSASRHSIRPHVAVSGDSTTTVTQLPPVASPPLSSRIELPSDTIVAGSKVHGTLVIENDSGAPVQQSRCPDDRLWGVYLVNAVASSGPPAYGGPGRLCDTTPPELSVGRTTLPFTFDASYNSCAPAGDSFPPTPKCLPGNLMPPLPAGDYRVEVDHVPYPGVPKPPVLTVHVVAG